ncbi:MAG: YggS family pyridoxal phosphate-dependent enzyme [Gammaproteobacteria bacterium]|nr:YggS family pyridoxal phosphate-dependent enzyme [Gammaproteobacteria bacterium]
MNAPGTVQFNLGQVWHQIHALESKYCRRTPVRLIGVGKTKSSTQIEAAIKSGLLDIAENYLQEALKKQTELSHLNPTWHFIGPIQSNKTARIAENFAWVHSVASIRIAERLNRQRPEFLGPLNTLIQVNISGEATKSGVSPESVMDLALAIQSLPNLRLRGLMAVPAHTDSLASQRKPFHALRELLENVQTVMNMSEINQLSMGMTLDMEAAIAEGSTMVRIGTAIFGARTKST